MTLADNARSLPVNGCFDQCRHLNALVVSNALLDKLNVVNAVDGGWQDDERSDIGSRIGFEDEKVDISVQSGVRQGVDGEEGRLRLGVGTQIRVDLHGVVVASSILYSAFE